MTSKVGSTSDSVSLVEFARIATHCECTSCALFDPFGTKGKSVATPSTQIMLLIRAEHHLCPWPSHNARDADVITIDVDFSG